METIAPGTFPKAFSKGIEAGEKLHETVVQAPSSDVVLPPDTIVESDPLGYLGGMSVVTPTGDFTWSLPLWTPPGRNGVQPNLSVDYAARGGAGLAGVGFSLGGLPEIRRCGQTMAIDGVVKGITYSDSDRFCISGQRLVLVDGVYGKSGSEYRIERDGFDKIIYYEGSIFTPSTFDVWAKDGTIAHYEALKVGRAEASPSPPYTLQPVEYIDALWVLTEVKDRAGNLARYHYEVIAFPDQPDQYTLEVLPESVEYTLKHGDMAGTREVRFFYEDRPDPTFAFVSGVRIRETKRLKAIELYAPDPTSKELVGRYEFSYFSSVSTSRSLLHTISRCDGEGVCLWAKEFQWQNALRPDFETIDLGLAEFPPNYFEIEQDTGIVVLDTNGDAKDEILYRLGWDFFVRRMDANKTPLGERIWIDPAETLSEDGHGFENILLHQSRPIDLNGDGKLELWAAQIGPEYWYHIFEFDNVSGLPKGTGKKLSTGVIQAGNNVYLDAIHFGDLNADGRPDLLRQFFDDPTTPLWDLWQNVDGELDNPLFSFVPANCARTARVLDSNGDGRAEVWNASTPACSESITAGLGTDGQPHVEDQIGLGYEAKQAIFADLNGDGLRDIVRPGSPSGWVRWSTGAGYGPKVDLMDGPQPEPNATGSMDQGTYVVDLNSDAREDILTLRLAPSPKIIAYLSKGDASFDPIEIDTWPGAFHKLEGFSTSRVGDFNGDALVDLVQVGQDGHLRVLLQKPGHVDVVEAIWDHLIAEHPREKIVYSNQWSDDPEPASCSYPQRCVRHGMPVVREHSVWQGSDVGQYTTIHYSYEDPRVDLAGRGFVGFRKVRVWDADRLSETTVTFDHQTRIFDAYPYAGLPMSVTHVAPILEDLPTAWPAPARARVTKVSRAYGWKPLNQWKTHFVYPSTWTSDEEEQDVLVTPDGLEVPANPNKVHLRHREGSFDFDDYGNRTFAEEKTQDGVHKKLVSTYEIRLDDWLISLPETTQFTSAEGGANPPPLPRETHFTHDALGFLETIQVEPNDPEPNQRLTTTFKRNSDGLVEQITWEAPGETARNVYIAYEDQERMFPVQTWNDLGFVETFAYYPALGVLAASTDIDGVETRRQYDGFGRLRRVETDGEAAVDVWEEARFEDGWVRGLIERSQSEAGDEGLVFLDELGRPVEEAWRGFEGAWVHAAVTYDHVGRRISVTRPGVGAPSTLVSTFSYDSLDRLLETKGPDGATTIHEHSFSEVKTWDPKGNESRTLVDIDGRIIKRIDLLDGKEIPTTYFYGPFDRIEHVIDAEYNQTDLKYDQRGRRTLLVDPDRGPTSFSYNGFDELKWETNALQQTTTYHRDVLGRVYQKDDADGVTSYVHDQGTGALGKLTEVTGPDGTKTELTYNALGRPFTATWTIEGESYVVGTRYDALGRLWQVEYPHVPNRPPFAIEYSYNAHNYVEEIRDKATGNPFWTVQERNAEGALTSGVFGNKVLETRGYHKLTGRLESVHAMGAGMLDVLEYTYDLNGNVHTRVDNVAGRAETFDHDALDRLKSWTLETGAGIRETSYDYSILGNLEKVFVNGKVEEDNGYGANGKPHALTSSLHGPYTYDTIGRVKLGGDREIWYSAFDLPTKVIRAGKTTELGYDGFQRRVRKSSGSDTTIYVADLYERRTKDGLVEHVFYVPGESGPVAAVHFKEKSAKEKTLYLHGDALGSVRVVSNEAGGEEQRVFFEPFGQRVDSDGSPVAQNFTPAVEVGFTGHHHDDDLGLVNALGRLYDPRIRRFISPDPIVSFPLFGQSFNRYSYCLNSPLSFTDPSGFSADDNRGPPPRDGPPTMRVGAPNLGGKMVRPMGKAQSPPKSVPQGTPKGSSDASGQTPDTGATAAPGQAVAEAPAPAAEVPSAPASPAPAAAATEGGSAAHGFPPTFAETEAELEPKSWMDDPDVQRNGGFLVGLGLGLVPFGGAAETALTATQIIDAGTREARIGLAVGEIFGGLITTSIGIGGGVAGAVLTATGLGAVAGVPALVGSATLLTGGAANLGAGVAGLWQALTTGAGSSGGGAPKAGSAGGPGAGKRFPEARKDVAEVQAGGNCVFCGKQTTRTPGPTQRNTDHAVPKSKGGNNTLENAQNTCRDCNLKKSTRTTEEYLNGKP